ncbi:C40 family peptidase [Paenirhodobacter hankyongi]|uniref:NLP/P60 hydrolase n=1 Tax=Paenirhodobacter hankyongi TaxID=2294033 RepID=A0A421BT36_9RHOB|nr:NlpC/P60 family protein [Sinirhodobacter hankyongi]RLL71466.1 NLP/P60 hydrolase [Sinirhodobacter hankyongi]
MSDRRLTPFSGRIALETLRGQVAAEAFTEGEPARVILPVVDLSPAPGALRDRQLIFGAAVTVIERRGAAAFVQAAADGYCGWVPAVAFGAPARPTHVVSAAATHVYREASIKRGEVMSLSLGARLAVLDEDAKFLRIAEGYVPRPHLRPLDPPETDPVAVAERLLGTPYLWGGNSREGIDCSGLVQVALALCGRVCPADSDQQSRAFGDFLPAGTVPQRGDLFFWKGHVAMACDGERLIHANGHTMSVAHEGIAACLARIEAAGDGPFLGLKRPGA